MDCCASKSSTSVFCFVRNGDDDDDDTGFALQGT